MTIKMKRLAAAALLCLSGCGPSPEEKLKVLNDFAENCRRNGGTAITKASTNNISFLLPSFVDVTCSLPPSSEAGAKDADKDGGAK
ncbi:MAG: hypothetical protein ACTFAL_12465 [Candidatus Electronema sp. V4]|uniref:hypothetical protein n=1 Tax=Candidatus Electronema sp. V4 TaxID=3454756 RepID=UPI0040557D55